MRGRITVSLKYVQKSLTSSSSPGINARGCKQSSTEPELVNFFFFFFSIGAIWRASSLMQMLPMYSASTLWKQTLRQLVSVAFCWDQNFTLSPITTRLDRDCVNSSYNSKDILSSFVGAATQDVVQQLIVQLN